MTDQKKVSVCSESSYSKSLLTARKALQDRKSETNYDEYLMAMKRVHHRYSAMNMIPTQIETPRARRRKQSIQKQAMYGNRVVSPGPRFS